MKVGDLVKTTLWGYGVVLDVAVKRFDVVGDTIVAMVLVERIVSGQYVRRITGPNLEVISDSR